MKVLRYIVTDNGITLIVDRIPPSDVLDELVRYFDKWAQMAEGQHFPLLVLLGDENTKVDDLRLAAICDAVNAHIERAR